MEYGYLTTLTRRRLDLKKVQQALVNLQSIKTNWHHVQWDGINQARYFVEKWLAEGRLPSPIEFKLFDSMLKRWFLRKYRRRDERDTSRDVIELLLVTQQLDVHIPSDVLRHITLFLGKEKAPNITSL